MTKKEDDKNLRKKDAKNLEIFLLTLPDVDDLIKDTFYFLTHPSATNSLGQKIFLVSLYIRAENGM